MIQSMPRDFNPVGYDLKTTDGTIWKIVEFEDHFELQSEAGSFTLMKLDGRFTVFAPGYRNINLHGFEVNGTSYELEEAVQNENWVYVPVPEPEPGEALYEKERAFALKLLQLATAFQIDLLALPDINIGTMLQAAQQAGATETEIANASAILLALAKDVEAESGMVWADTWLALKSRLPGYLQEE